MINNPSVLRVENVCVEDLFGWLFQTVCREGGDGAGAIVCGNYKETANLFELWASQKYKTFRDMYKKKTYPEYRQISFEDGQECLIFTDNSSIKLFPGEYIFIVCSDCKFRWHNQDKIFKEKVVQGIGVQ